MKHMKAHLTCRVIVIAALLAGSPLQAMETDQYYAWGKPIADSADYLNAWVKLTIQTALDESSENATGDCEAMADVVQHRMQQSIYHAIEMWVITSPLVDRIPLGLEEDRDYRKHYLLAKTIPVDTARWLNPSPTVQVDGIRLGTDKLAHFISEGWWYYRWWKKREDKYPPDELQRKMIQFSVKLESGGQGYWVTGVFSPSDLEANYQGFLFYQQLCHGEKPLLYQQDGRWRFSDAFDFRTYVTPDRDESWLPNIFKERRWKRIQKTVATYCPMLHTPWVEQQRTMHKERDTQSPAEKVVAELVAKGKLPDPATFGIMSVCGEN
ncbi:MAG: hypothetical protein EXR85_04915 [Xanthomonadales bacterium]|nr:hypothetical protein [Xanthomonadales bacterium]